MVKTLEQIPITFDRASARRQKIIRSARELFLLKGFHATGVAQISKASGIAVGQIYRDFACKEEIIAAIVYDDCSDFLEAESLQKCIDSGQAEQIWAWVGEFLDPEDHGPDVMLSEILAEAGRNKRVAEIFRLMRNDVLAAMLRALNALAPGDHLDSQRIRLANLTVALSIGFIQQRLMQTKDETALTCKLALKMLKAEVSALQQRATPVAAME